MNWRGWPYWMKGGVIGFFIGMVYYISNYLISFIYTTEISYLLLWPSIIYLFTIGLPTILALTTVTGILNLVGFQLDYSNLIKEDFIFWAVFWLIQAVAIIYYVLIGALIGAIVGKLKNRNKSEINI